MCAYHCESICPVEGSVGVMGIVTATEAWEGGRKQNYN